MNGKLDRAVVVEGGRLWVQWWARGALCELREHLTVLRGAGLSEGTKLSQNNGTKAEEMVFRVLFLPFMVRLFSVRWMT